MLAFTEILLKKWAHNIFYPESWFFVITRGEFKWYS